MTRRGPVLLTVLVAVLLLLAGCSTLPESGPVRRQAADRPDQRLDAPYFNPPGPAEDGSPAAIVSGFLVAMQANPLSTKVAREFLSERASASWRPNRGTMVYEASTVTPSAGGADVRLSDVRRLDSRGGWRNDPPGRSTTLGLDLVSEGGQWRIDNPVDALVVPTSFFNRSFERFDLYFFDQTGRTLLPDPVFIPRGEQSATNLVRGVLAGPGPALSEVTRSAFPRGTGLDLSVVVTESGVAEVPLTRDVLRAPPEDLERAVDQLAWTLRQVPGIERVRLTVGGAAVPLPGGSIDASVLSGDDYDAAGTTEPVLHGLRNGRVVEFSTGSARSVPGPLGKPGYAMRSLAVSEAPAQVSAVSADGTTVFQALLDGATDDTPVTRVVDGTDLLRPSYDLFGDLWIVDRSRSGARVLVVSSGRARALDVPGVSGRDVVAATVSRDGTRLAVVLGGDRPGEVRVVDVLRTDEGQVAGTGRTRVFRASTDGAAVVDVGWRDPGTLAVLTRPSRETSRVAFLSSDGSPVEPGLVEPSLFRGVGTALAVSPQLEVPLRLVDSRQQLFTLSDTGTWPLTSSKISAADYAP
ncbi:Sporulation and spore germination [Nocardioides scoriae]|uniref:Sporulation and spore germination n=1 Tax=Nocardioides scoriae TaxID=642780 RepID=A0A1H1QV09_9ACTN|nr:LpqB family beta-propeller domain-containing protein [Nocardioides scoriae]SDS27341.1 Sporulation and spore germination [Nocardioides scoriae]